MLDEIFFTQNKQFGNSKYPITAKGNNKKKHNSQWASFYTVCPNQSSKNIIFYCTGLYEGMYDTLVAMKVDR